MENKTIYPEIQKIKNYLISENILDEIFHFECFADNILTYSCEVGLHIHYELNIINNSYFFTSYEEPVDFLNSETIIYLEIKKYYKPYGKGLCDAEVISGIDFKIADYQNENHLNN